MGSLVEECKAMREDHSIHYGCSQAVFIPVARRFGMDQETAFRLSEHFRAGMFTGGLCGAITGGIMALSLAGAPPKATVEFQRRVLEAHQGDVDCNSLLSRWYAAGNTEKKPHCDQMCYACMAIVEELLSEHGKL